MRMNMKIALIILISFLTFGCGNKNVDNFEVINKNINVFEQVKVKDMKMLIRKLLGKK